MTLTVAVVALFFTFSGMVESSIPDDTQIAPVEATEPIRQDAGGIDKTVPTFVEGDGIVPAPELEFVPDPVSEPADDVVDAEPVAIVESAIVEDTPIIPDLQTEDADIPVPGEQSADPDLDPAINQDARDVPETTADDTEVGELKGSAAESIEQDIESMNVDSPAFYDDAPTLPDAEPQAIDQPATVPEAEIAEPVDQDFPPADPVEPWNCGCAPLRWL